MARDSEAYILRPPYLYGPGNNLYREAFVFDCARKKRPFYLPKNGEMKLQFFHVHDLCRLMDILLEKKPEQHIFNVGNQEAVSVADWVRLCYQAAGENLEVIPVFDAAGCAGTEKMAARNKLSSGGNCCLLSVVSGASG